MKNDGKILILLSVFNLALLVVVVVGLCRMDRTPPVISAHGALTYTKQTSDKDVLAILQAVDERDGDVSDTLTIEKIVPYEERNVVWITCGAKDHSNNVGKHTIEVSCDNSYFKKQGSQSEAFLPVAGEAADMMGSNQ